MKFGFLFATFGCLTWTTQLPCTVFLSSVFLVPKFSWKRTYRFGELIGILCSRRSTCDQLIIPHFK